MEPSRLRPRSGAGRLTLRRSLLASLAALAAAWSCGDLGSPTVIAAVAVLPEALSIEIGEARFLTAIATDAAGNQVVGVTVTFTSLDTAIATVSPGGLVTGRKAGTTSILAASGGAARTVSVTIAPATASIAIQPESLVVDQGGTGLLVAAALDASGNQITNVAITFSSGDTAIATTTAGGVVTGRRPGRTTATAMRGGVTRSAPIVVSPYYRGTVNATLALPSSAFALGISSTGVVYVGRDDNTLTRLNLPALVAAGEVGVPQSAADIAFAPTGTTAYVTSPAASEVGVVNVSTNTQASTIATPAPTLRARLAADGSRLYVTLTTGGVSVINTATAPPAVVTTVPVAASANGIAVDHTRPMLYVSSTSGNILEVNTATNLPGRTFATGGMPQDIVVSPNGAEIYVANEGLRRVDIWSLVTGNALATVTLDGRPFGMAASPDGLLLFVTLPAERRVVVIDPAKRKVVRSIDLGGTPRRVAMDPAGTTLVVTNEEAWVDLLQ